MRDDNGNPRFGINPWPEERYGEFYSGDSYIVLETTKNEDSDKFNYDIYFWIGKDSTQDEYGVAAYKAAELDSLLDDVPIQHREVQYHESDAFLNCLSGGNIKYLDGGIDGGFRHVDVGDNLSLPTRLYRVKKDGRVTRCFHVPAKVSSLNEGDSFVLDTGKIIFTWFGKHCSPFEKSKAAEVAHNMEIHRNGHSSLIEDVGNENEEFWLSLGGREEIQENGNYHGMSHPATEQTKMFILSDVDSFIKIMECEVSMDNLVTDDVCMVDTGKTVYVWIGNESSLREQAQAMLYAERYLKELGRDSLTQIIRILEGQELRLSEFQSAF
jgi:hypothetical protein